MPEGPEVRMCRDLLADTLKDRILVSVLPTSGKLERKGIPGLTDEFNAGLPSKVAEVLVRGKRILVMLENGSAVHSTLGMSGWWYPLLEDTSTLTGMAYMNGKPVEVKKVIDQAYKYGRVVLNTDKGPTAVFCDMRNFGNMACYTADQLLDEHPLMELGIDMLNELPAMIERFEDKQEWADGWRRYRLNRPGQDRKPVGEVLLDQRFVAGLGNIYRAEVLYSCGINPKRKFGAITDDEWQMIGWNSAFILDMAYQTQGTMEYPGWFLGNNFGYHMPPGYVYRGHLCYGRRKDFKGREIVNETVGGRTMWYCPERQP